MKTIQIGSDISARKNDSNHWEIKHPSRGGKMSRWYSTGLTGTERDLRRYIKEEKIEDLVAVGKRGALTEKVIAQLTSGGVRPTLLADIKGKWLDWIRHSGESPNTIHQYETYFNKWVSDSGLSKKPVNKIDIGDMDSFVNPEDSPIKRATRNARMHMLHSVFKYMVAMGHCPGNPSQLIKVNPRLMSHDQKQTKRVESYTKAEINKLLNYVESELSYAQHLVKSGESDPRIRKPYSRMKWMEFWQFAIRASYTVGLRQGDVCTLEWASLADSDHICVWTAKRESYVQIPLNHFDVSLRNSIEQITCTDAVLCFPEISEVYRSSRSTVSSYFSRLCRESKVSVKSFHALRHTAIRNMKKQLEHTGEDLPADEILLRIGKVVAHANASTTKGYL